MHCQWELCMIFEDHYHYYLLHGISDGIINRLGQEITYSERCFSIIILYTKLQVGVLRRTLTLTPDSDILLIAIVYKFCRDIAAMTITYKKPGLSICLINCIRIEVSCQPSHAMLIACPSF